MAIRRSWFLFAYWNKLILVKCQLVEFVQLYNIPDQRNGLTIERKVFFCYFYYMKNKWSNAIKKINDDKMYFILYLNFLVSWNIDQINQNNLF